MKFDKAQFRRHHGWIRMVPLMVAAVLFTAFGIIINIPQPSLQAAGLVFVFLLLTPAVFSFYCFIMVSMELGIMHSRKQHQAFDNKGVLEFGITRMGSYPFPARVQSSIVYRYYRFWEITEIKKSLMYIHVTGRIVYERHVTRALTPMSLVEEANIAKVLIPRNFSSEHQILGLDIDKYNADMRELSAGPFNLDYDNKWDLATDVLDLRESKRKNPWNRAPSQREMPEIEKKINRQTNIIFAVALAVIALFIAIHFVNQYPTSEKILMSAEDYLIERYGDIGFEVEKSRYGDTYIGRVEGREFFFTFKQKEGSAFSLKNAEFTGNDQFLVTLVYEKYGSALDSCLLPYVDSYQWYVMQTGSSGSQLYGIWRDNPSIDGFLAAADLKDFRYWRIYTAVPRGSMPDDECIEMGNRILDDWGGAVAEQYFDIAFFPPGRYADVTVLDAFKAGAGQEGYEDILVVRQSERG
ncbi:MAG: hypothetical protein FWG03_05230 [Clostridiales bacterium]|nr:hypothetical protein [Clostridiales bacterium]